MERTECGKKCSRVGDQRGSKVVLGRGEHGEPWLGFEFSSK